MYKHRVRIFTLVIIILFIFLVGCSVPVELADDDPFNFMSYSGSNDILSIEQVELDDTLAKKCVSYKFTYTVDYNSIIGYIGIPVDCLKNKTPYPCAVYNRGGNRDFGMLEKQDVAYLSAQSEMIVIASQYRGSTGSTGRDEFGGDDINDVIKLIDICEKLKFVSMDNLYLVGESRGGMMSYISAKQDNRIKKMVIISGISDVAKFYQERNDMEDILDDLIGGSPEEISEEYQKRSAVKWSDQINIPVLIIHSKKDEKVSFSQAQAMVEALKQNNKNCSFVVYDDNIHGFHQQDIKIVKKWLNGEDISGYTSN